MAAAPSLPLRHGRSLVLDAAGDDDVVEVRDAEGALELRIRLTEDGPVLQMEGVRLRLRASEALDLQAPQVSVGGDDITLSGRADVRVDAGGDVRVSGETIYLN